MSWRRAQKHNIATAQPLMARVGANKLVLSHEYVEVESNNHLIKSQPGMCKCTLCHREFLNHPRVRKLHLNSKTHRAKLQQLAART